MIPCLIQGNISYEKQIVAMALKTKKQKTKNNLYFSCMISLDHEDHQ